MRYSRVDGPCLATLWWTGAPAPCGTVRRCADEIRCLRMQQLGPRMSPKMSDRVISDQAMWGSRTSVALSSPPSAHDSIAPPFMEGRVSRLLLTGGGLNHARLT